MDMDDDGVTDPTAEFGELFEGQTVTFESDLGVHSDDVLGAMGHDSSHHHRTHHPSDHDILSANIQPFVPDDYLQHHHQHIVIDSENSEYMVPIGDIAGLEGDVAQHQHGLQQIYIHHSDQEQQMQDVHGNAISYEFAQVMEEMNQPPAVPLVEEVEQEEEGPKVKQKVNVLKDVVYFTQENMKRYLKQRGFKLKGMDPQAQTISKTVLALTAEAEISKAGSRIVSSGSKFENEYIIQEVERFWKFYLLVKSKSLIMSLELVPFLMPMLLHFYFQTMFAGAFLVTRRICVDFGKKFLLEEKIQENYDKLVSIMKINSLEMLKADVNLMSLAVRPYDFVLSELTLVQLRRFLSKSTQPILIHLFTERFNIRIRESKALFENIDWDTLLDSEESDKSDDDDEEENERVNADVSQDASVMAAGKHANVKDVIYQLRDSVTANLPAISVYTTSDTPVCGAISKKGTLIAYGLLEAGIRICPVENARDVEKCMDIPVSEADLAGIKYCGGHSGTVSGVHFHPKTKLLFSTGQDSLMRVWDLNLENPGCRAIYRGHTGPIWKLDIPDSGSLIATAGFDTTARIFVPERTEFVRIMVGHYFGVNTVKFHPNEAYIATGSVDKSVRLWSVNDGNLVRMFTGAAGSINAVAYHDSGKYLAGAGEEGKIFIWDLAEGEVIVVLDSIPNCRDLIFNGNQLTACFRNGILQIFNLQTTLGGPEIVEEDESPSSVFLPFTTQCFASSLFKVFYKDPGMLYCLGSDLVCEEPEEPENYEESENPSSDNGTHSDINATILHQVLQNQMETDGGGESSSGCSSCCGTCSCESGSGSNGNESGSNGNESGSNGNESGSNGNESGSNGNESGSNGNESGSGSNGNESGSNGNESGSNGNESGSGSNGNEDGSGGYGNENWSSDGGNETDGNNGSTNPVAGSSRILAARLSQPLSVSGGEEEIVIECPLSEGTTGVPTPLTNETIMHESPLDAAINSVINAHSQEGDSSGGGGSSVGSGTITMYASS